MPGSAMRGLFLMPADKPIVEPVSKFGGDPVWIGPPQWPLADGTGEPMGFICQFRLPPELRRGGHEMAYVFMAGMNGDEVVCPTSADFGENAVILQPGPFEPNVKTQPLTSGPTLKGWRDAPGVKHVDDWQNDGRELVPVEYCVREQVVSDRCSEDAAGMMAFVGGEPSWVQGDETPEGGPWDLLAQIHSYPAPYVVEFGDAGVAYVFIRRDGHAAKMLCQCC